MNVLCDHPYLVSLLFAILLSLHLETFFKFFYILVEIVSVPYEHPRSGHSKHTLLMAVFIEFLQSKESHLQDLVDAKALALAQADRLIHQYRRGKAESDTEVHRDTTITYIDASIKHSSLNQLRKGIKISTQGKAFIHTCESSYLYFTASSLLHMKRLDCAAKNENKFRNGLSFMCTSFLKSFGTEVQCCNWHPGIRRSCSGAAGVLV